MNNKGNPDKVRRSMGECTNYNVSREVKERELVDE